jgi:2-oxoglutarate ferredoxin oxidoreductase subunit delta
MVKITQDKCKGCGLCITVCPQKILSLSVDTYNNKGIHPIVLIDPEKCVDCGLCSIMCPDMALEI